MGFLSPWFLAGLAALGLPLWLHLLRQYRSVPRPFSSLMFFEKRPQSSLRHRRLRHLLLLALRLALLALLAMAFANPFVASRPSAAQSRRMLVVAIDRSFSMRFDGRMERAKRAALDALNAWPSGGLVEVLAVDSQVEPLTQSNGAKDEQRAAILSLDAGDRASSFGEFARALRALAASAPAALDVRFFTDAQNSSLPPDFADLKLPPGARLAVETPPPAPSPNWAVESVSAPDTVFDQARHRVAAVVAGFGTAAASRKVELLVDGRVIDSKTVPVPAGGRVPVDFDSLAVPFGSHRGEIRIQPADRLPQDDRFEFPLHHAEPGRVLFLAASPRSPDLFYFRAALEASAPSAYSIEESLPGAILERGDLAKFSFIVACGAAGLPRSVADKLDAYVREGGGLLALNGGAPPVANARRAGMVDASHPVLRLANGFAGVRFSRVAPIGAADGRVIARLEDGAPLLADRAIGRGHKLVFATGLDNSSSDLPLHPSFVPFVERTALYLSGANALPAVLTAGSLLEIHRPGEAASPVDAIGPDGRHLLSLAESANAPSLALDRDGFYELHRANRPPLLIAVNASRRESDLAPIPPDVIALWTHGAPDGDAPSSSAAPPPDAKRGFWRFLLALALVAAVAESLAASGYLKKEAETP